jgi:membrane-associated phospholipid phosphatase
VPLASPARLDHALLRLARTRGHAPVAERAVAAFSRTGEHAALWLVLGAFGAALDADRRPRRARPVFDGLPQLVATPTQLSFPSAHAASSFAAARAYAPLLGAAGPALYPLAAAMAASRVYLGVHYPSDIVAGALLGTLVGELSR